MSDPVLEADLQTLAEQQASALGATVTVEDLDADTQEKVRKNLVARFSLGASRTVKRAALRTKNAAASFTHTVGQGIVALMPLVGFLIGVSIILAGVGAALGLSSWALSAAFAIHPLAGWAIIAFVALTCTKIVWNIVSSAFGVFGTANTFA